MKVILSPKAREVSLRDFFRAEMLPLAVPSQIVWHDATRIQDQEHAQSSDGSGMASPSHGAIGREDIEM
jgi:hypothetical protein